MHGALPPDLKGILGSLSMKQVKGNATYTCTFTHLASQQLHVSRTHREVHATRFPSKLQRRDQFLPPPMEAQRRSRRSNARWQGHLSHAVFSRAGSGSGSGQLCVKLRLTLASPAPLRVWADSGRKGRARNRSRLLSTAPTFLHSRLS